ncbi:MAG: histidinol-phosphate transaminase [Chloroflexi bacterium]|nr:histidinol-phosphate transaminase [Chloroflexota bacterium]
MTTFVQNPNLLKVPLYVAGKSVEEVQEEYGLADVVKMASNENALGPSPMAMAAAQKWLAESHRYPGIAERDLRRAIGPRIHPSLNERNVLIGNGATDVIRMIAQSFVFNGGETVTCKVAFPMYHLFTTMFGGKPVLVPPTPDLRFDLPAIAAAITPDTRLVFLCAPNNPTGLIFSRAEVDDFMSRVPEHVAVVFDEAYFDFVDEEADYGVGTEYVVAGRNAIVVRSFSKSAGLANMRVGYAAAKTELIEYLHHAQLPFNSGAVALAAARASLDDADYARRSKQLAREERKYMYAALDALYVSYVRSQANFVLLTDLPMPAAALAESLIRHGGVVVRPMAAWGMPNAVRMTLGTHAENERFVATLKVVLEDARKN